MTWNDVCRKLCKYQRWVSVNQLIFYCVELDFEPRYDVRRFRYKFLTTLGNNIFLLTVLFYCNGCNRYYVFNFLFCFVCLSFVANKVIYFRALL